MSMYEYGYVKAKKDILFTAFRFVLPFKIMLLHFKLEVYLTGAAPTNHISADPCLRLR